MSAATLLAPGVTGAEFFEDEPLDDAIMKINTTTTRAITPTAAMIATFVRRVNRRRPLSAGAAGIFGAGGRGTSAADAAAGGGVVATAGGGDANGGGDAVGVGAMGSA